MNKLIQQWHALANDESGAVAIEYGLLAALIALGIVTGATALRGGLNGLFNTIVAALGAAA